MNEQEFEKQLNALHERVLSKALSECLYVQHRLNLQLSQ